MANRAYIRSLVSNSSTPIDIRRKREEKGLFPFYTQGRKKFDSLSDVLEYVETLGGSDPSREILGMFPEYFFESFEILKFLQIYNLSKEVGAPAFSGTIQDYPCDYLDFIDLLTLERNLYQKEQNVSRKSRI